MFERFLLKYVSRDELEIYKRGSGGVVEARTAIADYEDKSPLYGFLVYRRRKVLLKYIPEGTSRLLQGDNGLVNPCSNCKFANTTTARVAVHFTSFEEKFTPYDSVFPLTSHIELTETALSQACSLHSAADSSRSSGASATKKNKLDEIVEDPKERPSYDARTAAGEKLTERKPLDVPEIIASLPIEKDLPVVPDDVDTRPTTRESLLPNDTPLASRKAAKILGLPLSSVSSGSIETPTRRPTTPAAAGDAASIYAASLGSPTRSDHYANLGGEPRASTSSATRPSLSDLEFYALYPHLKPKVKLGPRPSIDPSKSSSSGPRPVSSLPKGVRQRGREFLHSNSNTRPTSRSSALSANYPVPPPPPIPEIPEMPTYIRPSSSPASVKSMPMTLASKNEKLTKEKRRLMKAVEIRKKQLQAAKSQPTTPTKPNVPVVTEAPPMPAINKKADAGKEQKEKIDSPESQREAVVEPVEEGVMEDLPQQIEKEWPPNIEELPPEEASTIPTLSVEAPEKEPVRNPTRASGDHLKADSGVQIEVDRTSRALENEHKMLPSSSPISVEQSSEMPSTRPSSISEVGEEAAIADPWAKGTDESPREATQADEYNETVSVASNDELQVSRSELASEKQKEETASDSRRNKERADEFQVAAQADESSADEADEASDVTPTEKSIAFTNDGNLTLTFPERKASIREKRQAIMRPLSPLSIDPHAHALTDDSEVDESDDDFMHELRNAKVQEAKPVQVSKSPLPTVFPTLKPATVMTVMTPRSASNPAVPTVQKRRPNQPKRSTSEASLDDTPRSFSATQLKPTPEHAKSPQSPGSIGVARKGGVSSGISQRIKALARNSGSDENLSNLPRQSEPSRESNGSSIVALRKSSFRDATPPSFLTRPQSTITTHNSVRDRVSTHNSVRDRVSSFSKDPTLPPPSTSHSSASGNETPKLRDSIQTVYNVQQRNDNNRQSISVTARIVRDPRTEKPNMSMPNQATPLELHESPLTIEHKRGLSVPRLEMPPVERSPSLKRKTDANSPFSSPVQDPAALSPVLDRGARSPVLDRGARSPISPLPRPSSDTSRKDRARHSRRASEARSPTFLVRSSSQTSLDTAISQESKSSNERTHERKGSRGSRMLRRMSNSISLGRKTLAEIVSPKIKEEDNESLRPQRVPEEVRLQTPTHLEIGELNVQLPDTLLWKRRWVEIDGDGYFVVKPSKSNELATTKYTKQFHLSEFRRPFLPDREIEEMPNSVVLDFVDGRTLQCACESGNGQMEVLRLLQDAHSQWSDYAPS